MFNLFKKKIINCEKCSKPLKKYHVFDPTSWKDDFHSKKIKLCTSCMIIEYKKCLNDFSGKAIFIEPMKNYISYPYYTFDEVEKEAYWEKEGMNALKKLINQESECIECNKKTKFLLCSSEIYHNSPIKEFDITNNDFSKLFLCADCLCNHLEKNIIQNDIYFNKIYPPKNGDGLATSFNP